MRLFAGLLVPTHPNRPPRAMVVSRSHVRHPAPLGRPGVEAAGVRDTRRPEPATLGNGPPARGL